MMPCHPGNMHGGKIKGLYVNLKKLALPKWMYILDFTSKNLTLLLIFLRNEFVECFCYLK